MASKNSRYSDTRLPRPVRPTPAAVPHRQTPPRVLRVHGRTGDVVGEDGDYDSDNIDNASGVSGANVTGALDTLDGEKQDAERFVVRIDSTDSPYDESLTRGEGVEVILVDTSGGDVEILLTSVALGVDRPRRIVHDVGDGLVTLTPDGSDTVDDSVELVLPYAKDVVTLFPNSVASDWMIV